MSPHGKIYIVDDDADVRNLLTRTCEAAGYSPVTFPSAEAFLAAYDDAGDRPRCLLLDLRMPGMGGLNLTKRLHQTGALIPVVLLTAAADVETAVEAMRFGAVDFLEKPVSKDQLLQRIEQAIDQNGKHLAERSRRSEFEERLKSLTSREREAFDLLVKARNTKQIAAELNIGVQTVAKHRSRVLRKLGAANEVELALLASAHTGRLPSPRGTQLAERREDRRTGPT